MERNKKYLIPFFGIVLLIKDEDQGIIPELQFWTYIAGHLLMYIVIGLYILITN